MSHAHKAAQQRQAMINTIKPVINHSNQILQAIKNSEYVTTTYKCSYFNNTKSMEQDNHGA